MSENSLLVPNESNSKCNKFKKSFTNLFKPKYESSSLSNTASSPEQQISRLTSTAKYY